MDDAQDALNTPTVVENESVAQPPAAAPRTGATPAGSVASVREAGADSADATPATASRRGPTVLALLLAISMTAMEATVVATAMPTVIADLGGVAFYAWVGSVYLLGSTVTIPLYGRLADVVGRKGTLLTGILLFVIGSLGSGFAPSIGVLIAARALQGMGAGGVQPVALTIVGDLFPLAERSKVQGLFSGVWAAAGMLGPMLGAFFVHTLSWRWVFWVNVPFGLAAMFVLNRCYRERLAPTRDRSLDLGGAALITLGSIALLLGTSDHGHVALALVGLAAFAGFVVVELRVRSPMLPIALVTRRPIAVATAASFLFGAILMALVLFTPLYVQGARGGSPFEAGLVVAPSMVGWPIAALLTSRWLVHTGFRTPLWVGTALVALSTLALTLIVVLGGSLVAAGTAMFAFGFGSGLSNTSLLLAVQSTVGFAQRGVATALNLFARMMGGALGVGLLGALVTTRLAATVPVERVTALLMRDGSDLADKADRATLALLDSAVQPLFIVCAALAFTNLLIVALWPRTVALEDVVR